MQPVDRAAICEWINMLPYYLNDIEKADAIGAADHGGRRCQQHQNNQCRQDETLFFVGVEGFHSLIKKRHEVKSLNKGTPSWRSWRELYVGVVMLLRPGFCLNIGGLIADNDLRCQIKTSLKI